MSIKICYEKPPLTTIALPLHDIGYKACQIIIGILKKEEVKLLMKQNQVKQWEVAEAMGISEFTLCRWLRKDWKGKQLERLNSAIKKVRSGKEETHREEER